ncbi:hypothetical protein Bca4012_051108 [Brassica carinata]|uniref:Uncharacterized protein n=1 Tax=Brassica cretica TaxID=69181 RepID=A0A8S9QAR1_BRACR|nr:hypothetical protein F2Q69_00021986 [Brassica cretica]
MTVLSSGNILRLPISAVYDDYHKAKTRRRYPYSSPAGSSSTFANSRNGGLVGPRQHSMRGDHHRLHDGIF